MKVFFLSFCVISFFILFPLIRYAEADCLNCLIEGGSQLGCTGDTKFDFISKCGAPDYSEEVAEETAGSIGHGSLNVTTQKIEVMFYNCGDGKFNKLVKVRGGKVISIKNGARGSGPVKCM